MPNYNNTLPMIAWGAGFANTLRIGYRLDNVHTGDEPRAGSSTKQAPSGVEDAWDVGTDFVITFDFRYIPREDTAVPLATGWDGETGVRAWLSAARRKQLFRFYPDATGEVYIPSYLVAPMTGQGEVEEDGTRRLLITLRNPTIAYEGYGD